MPAIGPYDKSLAMASSAALPPRAAVSATLRTRIDAAYVASRESPEVSRRSRSGRGQRIGHGMVLITGFIDPASPLDLGGDASEARVVAQLLTDLDDELNESDPCQLMSPRRTSR
ncbi:MAG TPA: hypothetical protein VGR11_01730 [Solirubrobacteraceae bacterium]|nr:hypothetical protein [Solirubrobacteraceae bacterium]